MNAKQSKKPCKITLKMTERNFFKNDSGFVCVNCKKVVEKLGYSSRNHCPHCLHSLHVDVNPGDRANSCGGVLEPVGIEIKSNKGYVINFVCKKCKEKRRNVAASDDSLKKIIEVSSKG